MTDSLVEGSEISLTSEEILGTGDCVPIDYDKLPQEVEVGDTILLDDGLLEFKVTECLEKSLKANVIVGGLLKFRKGKLTQCQNIYTCTHPKDRNI